MNRSIKQLDLPKTMESRFIMALDFSYYLDLYIQKEFKIKISFYSFENWKNQEKSY